MTEMSETTLAPVPVEVQKGWGGQSVRRKEDKRLLQGEGVFVDDVKRHGMGYLHFVRSPYAHAHITRVEDNSGAIIGIARGSNSDGYAARILRKAQLARCCRIFAGGH